MPIWRYPRHIWRSTLNPYLDEMMMTDEKLFQTLRFAKSPNIFQSCASQVAVLSAWWTSRWLFVCRNNGTVFLWFLMLFWPMSQELDVMSWFGRSLVGDCEIELPTFYLEKSGKRFGSWNSFWIVWEIWERLECHCVLLCNDSFEKKSRLTVKPVWLAQVRAVAGLTAPCVFMW